MNEFKPGDVVVHPKHGRGIVQEGEAGWVEFADLPYGITPLPDVAADLRRLVVIDPEDREQVERLAAAHHHAVHISEWEALHPNVRRDFGERMQAALREFANPKPPKPEEPTGLGAVVEDAEGDKWVWTAQGAEGSRWLRVGPPLLWATWDAVDAVRVLSEGVQR